MSNISRSKDNQTKNKSSHQRCSVKKDVLKHFANFKGKYVLESLFKKVANLQACNFIKKNLQHRRFPVKNLCERLLLYEI